MKLLTVLVAILAASFAQDKIIEQFDGFFKNGSKSLEPRIAGGATAMPNEFPYQVGLVLLTVVVDKEFQVKQIYNWCGGSLLNSNHVLTAAHCLKTALAGVVMLGTHNIKSIEINRKTFTVDKSHWIIHSNYDYIYNSDDIALIKLPQEVVFNAAIQPINLPPSSLDDSKLVGRLATASGWGRTGDIKSTAVSLQFANLRILNAEECEKVYNVLNKLFIKSNICVDGSSRKSVCPGDSGGPLVIKNDDGAATLIGITSFGHKKGCEKGIPTAFTRITSYLDWINSKINS